jgi:uncharacterized protein with PQ loop repeat
LSYEIIGTLASVIVLLSFVVSGEKRIRVINIFGAALFVVYGVFIGAFSVWFLNAALLVIHAHKLRKAEK